DKDAATKKREQQDKAQSDQAADAAIDERYRARYVRMMFTYKLDNGEERQIILETYVPPFPSDNPDANANGSDSVPPNNGTGGASGGSHSGSSRGGSSGRGGSTSGRGGSSSGTGGTSGRGGASGGTGGTSGKGGKKGN